MGFKYEVNANIPNKNSNFGYTCVLLYFGDSFFKAMAAIYRAKKAGAYYTCFEWR